MEIPAALGIIAGSGAYPLLLADAAREAGVKRIVVAAFTGETDARLAQKADEIEWLRVGQLSRLIEFFRKTQSAQAMMAGQIAPKNLFNLRPDWKALLLLARLERRNAESLFGAIADELTRSGTKLLPATTFLERYLAPPGLICGPKLNRREESDVAFGFGLAKEISRLNVGQTVVVKNGTVVAVEAFEGTNEAIRRGGVLARRHAVVVKVTKPDQDMRFDVPVIGLATIEVVAEVGVRVIAVEAGRTLLLEKELLLAAAARRSVSIVGCGEVSGR